MWAYIYARGSKRVKPFTIAFTYSNNDVQSSLYFVVYIFFLISKIVAFNPPVAGF